jgi:signal transduction histidine kinase/DNA-binding response OmpR family regulator/HAMP domain-containing protein
MKLDRTHSVKGNRETGDGSLEARLRQMLTKVISFRDGNFSVRLPSNWNGIEGQIAKAINQVISHEDRVSREVERLSRTVGREGRLTQRMSVPGAIGGWAAKVDCFNTLLDDLVRPTTEISRTIGAVTKGDLGQSMELEVDGRPLKGEFLRSAKLVNTMIEQLAVFSSEVTRVAREVGIEGKLGGQAHVRAVSGVWKELTDSVNQMAGNLTAQVRNIAEVTIAVASGDLSKKITVDVRGEILQLKEAINTMVEQLRSFASEVTRVAREVGTEGRLGVQAVVPGVAGTWKDLTDSVNTMGSNLTAQVRNIAEVTTAVARGDLNRKITVDVKGEILELKNTINTMVDQLNAFAGEVSRVARDVGTEGKLGGQAVVPGVAGTWKDLTDNVNFMASNLTEQVRGIVKVVTAVANGNLSQRLTVQAKGEVAALADTINDMTDTLATFAEQVTNVAREVGVEGRLGGQANVPGAAGTWRDLTGNVNLLAANLTSQVRAIAEVATAVTKGDLTRSIQAETRGEVAELKDNINTMISNLRETTERNREQDWLKTNLARFAGMLQGQRDLGTVGRMLLSELCPLVRAHQGTIYHLGGAEANRELRLLSSYARTGRQIETIRLGEGLLGQCAVEKKRILLSDVPPQFIGISSSLGEAPRVSIVVLPVLFEGETKAVVELATAHHFTEINLAFLDHLTVSIGVVFNTIEATMRTEGLLEQSQRLTTQLQSRQSELQQTNEELAAQAKLLAEQKAEVERKNTQVEQARVALEEKAAELALTSKYKSEFLANMSHELRTPLNSILILSRQLADNPAGTLSDKQVEFCRNINSSGSDLLNLINDILDLSKIESGTVTLEIEEIPFAQLRDNIGRTFRHVAEAKNLPFNVEFADGLPHNIESDPQRLQQILKNLLSNAVKFTAIGHVNLRVNLATAGWSVDHPTLSRVEHVVAFSVEDTGIGIAPDKQKLIFEAFQQADAGTSRKYGGTGLGLAICRDLAPLLKGEIKLTSVPGQGSTFTLYLPLRYSAAESRRIQQLDAVSPTRARTVTALPNIRRERIEDDREAVVSGEPLMLIIEDDPQYARILLDLARDSGFKGIVALTGSTGLSLASTYNPTAISLDIFLPDMLGWTVLNQLKLNPTTRHIPVQIISVEEQRQHGLARGAFGYYVKEPTTDGLRTLLGRVKDFTARRVKRLLILEDNEIERRSIVELLDYTDVEITALGSGGEAIDALTNSVFDCMVLDLRLPDMTGFELLERLKAEPALADMPVVVFTGKEPTTAERTQLRSITKSIVLKDVKSPERLLDQTALFLHRVTTDLPKEKQAMLERIHRSDVLRGLKVLVVDDDARNIFALASLLENQEMDVLTATTGRTAIEIVGETPDLSIVLMDIMMPGMDGYETIRNIRQDPQFRTLPILALTAKAMKGDREKCLDAGASDYIAKPVNTDQLLSLMRVWLFH